MSHSYQYNCVVGLLQLFNTHILPYVDIAIEVTARMFGCLGECVDDILAGTKDPIYSKKMIQEHFMLGSV